MELGLTIHVLFWHIIDHAMFYVEPWAEFLEESGILVGYVLGIGSTLIATALWAYLKKEQSNWNTKYLGCGKIRYSKSELISSGSTGSNVYQGKYERMDAAIKVIKLANAKEYQRLKKKFSLKDPLATDTNREEGLDRKRLMREVSINQAITLSNDFIVQYHGTEVYLMNKTVYLLIALELCKANLQDMVDMWNDFKPLNTRMILRQLGASLYFLHGNNYVHRDLKPSNVLIKRFSHPDQWRVKLADFGATKTAEFIQGRGNFSISGAYGSGGWVAPEAIQDVNRGEGKSSGDIFSMGLIFYFVITKGNKLYETQDDIQSNSPNVSVETSQEFPTEMDLIAQMTHLDEKKRPSADEVRKHPALWDSQQMLNFTASVNEVFKRVNVPELETDHQCFQVQWHQGLTPAVSKAMVGRKYSFTSVKDLIHGIRNYGVHYSSQPRAIKREFGSYPDGYIKYWMKRFPGLLIHTYKGVTRKVTGELRFDGVDNFRYRRLLYLKNKTTKPMHLVP